MKKARFAQEFGHNSIYTLRGTETSIPTSYAEIPSLTCWLLDQMQGGSAVQDARVRETFKNITKHDIITLGLLD